MKTLIVVLLCCASSFAQTASADFEALVNRYFASYFQFHPSAGTAAGFHHYDTKPEDMSQATFKAELATLSGAASARR